MILEIICVVLFIACVALLMHVNSLTNCIEELNTKLRLAERHVEDRGKTIQDQRLSYESLYMRYKSALRSLDRHTRVEVKESESKWMMSSTNRKKKLDRETKRRSAERNDDNVVYMCNDHMTTSRYDSPCYGSSDSSSSYSSSSSSSYSSSSSSSDSSSSSSCD